MEGFELVMDHVIAGDVVLDEEGRRGLKDIILSKIISVDEGDVKALASIRQRPR